MRDQDITTNFKKEELSLKAEIDVLKKQLTELEKKVLEFESVLRSELANELVEVQELTVLYKKQKQAKKEKRLAQKQRGKSYVPPTDLLAVAKTFENLSIRVDKMRGEDFTGRVFYSGIIKLINLVIIAEMSVTDVRNKQRLICKAHGKIC